jgi:hypothetical protein
VNEPGPIVDGLEELNNPSLVGRLLGFWHELTDEATEALAIVLVRLSLRMDYGI